MRGPGSEVVGECTNYLIMVSAISCHVLCHVLGYDVTQSLVGMSIYDDLYFRVRLFLKCILSLKMSANLKRQNENIQ